MYSALHLDVTCLNPEQCSWRKIFFSISDNFLCVFPSGLREAVAQKDMES